MDQTKKLKGNKSFLRQNWKNNIPEPVGYSKSSSKRKVHSNKCLYEEAKKMKVKVAQPRLTLYDPVDYTVHGILQEGILKCVAFPFFTGSSLMEGMEPRSPALQADSLPAETQGKPKNTAVSSLSLLQRIFPAQESNQPLKKNEKILPFATTWMDLEGIMPSKISEIEKD